MTNFMQRFFGIFAGLIVLASFMLTSNAISHPIAPSHNTVRMYKLESYQTVPAVLPAPTGLHVSARPGHALISWNAVKYAKVYELVTTRFDRPLSVTHADVYLRPGSYSAKVRAGRSAHDIHGHWTTIHFMVPWPAPVFTGSAAKALSWAFKQAGKPYIWGGTGPAGFDCSGLAMMSYEHAGIPIPRTTFEMLASSKLVSTSNPQPGDLAFYGSGHVELFVKSGETWGAHQSGTVISPTFYAGPSWRPTMFFRVV